MGNNKITDKNRLSMRNPELCREWDYKKNGDLSPEDVGHGSRKKVWWICKEGHEWISTICNRTNNKNGCPYCSGHKTSSKNKLLNFYPNLLEEWDFSKNNIDINTLSRCSTQKVWWKCKNGHHWRAIVYSRANGSGCPYCLNQKADETNCIARTHPHLLKNWNFVKNINITPYNTVIGSEKEVWWVCDKGHEYKARPSYLKSNDKNIGSKRGWCPYCNNIKVCNETCLATRNPELAKEWHPIKNNKTAFDVFPNTNKIYWWKCGKGHEWETSPNHRCNGGNNCPICSKISLLDGTVWDSITEAYVYLKFKNKGFKIEPHKKYGKKIGKSVCDFYLVDYNTYVEITSFSENYSLPILNFWKNYLKKIDKKEKFVKEILKANFRFISIKRLNKAQRAQVERNIKRRTHMNGS